MGPGPLFVAVVVRASAWWIGRGLAGEQRYAGAVAMRMLCRWRRMGRAEPETSSTREFATPMETVCDATVATL